MASPVLPLLLRASSGWLGDDGNWSTFSIGVGTPNQLFNVLPSTAASEVWLPLPAGCADWISNCSASRGVVATQTGGFQSNESTTWSQLGTGIYDLAFENGLFGSGDNGLYGQDVVSIDGGAHNLSGQTVAGISSANIWLGSLGLGVEGSQFGGSSTTTLLASLKSENLTSSLSYGYAAGAYYRSSPGSLVIGGYDASALTGSAISRPAVYSGSRSLTINLRSVLASNTLSGSLTVPINAGGLNMSVDSTVSQMWFPQAVCDSIAAALGLTYDNATGLYLVNSTTHGKLVQNAPYFTFTLAADGTASQTINIKIPWSGLDFAYGGATYPDGNMPYFPMRRAANESQYVLGRAFLQEAYIAVDWERMNFTIGQASHTTSASGSIVPILSPNAPSSTGSSSNPNGSGSTEQSQSGGPGAGMFAGIAVGVVAVVAIACGAGWYFWRKRRQQRRQQEETATPRMGTVEYFQDNKDNDYKQQPLDLVQEVPGSPPPPGYKEWPSRQNSPKPELAHSPIHELQGEMRHHLMSTPVHELPSGEVIGHELENNQQRKVDGYPFPAIDSIESAGPSSAS